MIGNNNVDRLTSAHTFAKATYLLCNPAYMFTVK